MTIYNRYKVQSSNLSHHKKNAKQLKSKLNAKPQNLFKKNYTENNWKKISTYNGKEIVYMRNRCKIVAQEKTHRLGNREAS